jgi:hypothetical protein
LLRGAAEVLKGVDESVFLEKRGVGSRTVKEWAAMKLQGNKTKAINPRNAYMTFAREPSGSEEFGVLVAGDYGVVEYAVTPRGLDRKRELGNDTGTSCRFFA